jgi:hypothetical protein
MIIKAAIKYKGKLYLGKRHHEIICAFINSHGKRPYNCKEGFVDENIKFLDRKRAGENALKCGQLLRLSNPPLLSSWDLWR